MMVFKYDISDIAAQDMECFRDMTAYVSSYIISIDKTENGEMYFNITDGHADEVRRKLDILKNSLSESKYDCSVEEKVFFSTADHQTLNNASIYEELLGREDIIKITDGVYAYGGLFLKVYNYFSEYFSKAAREMFVSELLEYKVPVLYPAKEYERGKYFENFPHHIMFQTLIKNDIEVLERFAEKSMDNGKLLEEMQVPKNVLRHAACVPVYKWNENTVRKYESSKKYLISGKCFRNEDKNVCELLRLNEFYMKEIVFIGKPAQVAENLEYSRQHLWFELIDKFGLVAEVKSANDSFFASNYKKLRLFQKLGESKFEFRMYIPARDTTLAVGSSNLHRTHFTMEYGIRTPEEYCHSGCIAYGIDRLAYAFLCQKGLDIDKWDEYSRNEIIK